MLRRKISTVTNPFMGNSQKKSLSDRLPTLHVPGNPMNMERRKRSCNILAKQDKTVKLRLRRHTVHSGYKTIEEKRVAKRSLPKDMLVALFKKALRLVRTMCRVALLIRRYAVNKSDTRVLADFQNFLKPTTSDMPEFLKERRSIYFNKYVYSIDSNYIFPTWARKVCHKLPETRSTEELKKLQRYLRSHPLFSLFDDRTQFEITKNALYHRYDRKRIILNQGDNAEYFYLMISGNIYVNISHMDKNTGVDITATVDNLKGPCAFGGTALMYGTKRTASVVCDTFVETLLIDSDTFMKYCADVLIRQHQAQKTFLHSHQIFKTWSQARMKLLSYDFKCQTYRALKVIDQDLISSNYVYFVMEGSVDVVYSNVEDDNKWLHSNKLNRQVGILGGNRIYAPSPCNLKSILRTDGERCHPIKVLLISNEATILYIPRSRFREIAPKSFIANYQMEDEFDFLSSRQYEKEKRRAIQWMEYRDETTRKIVKYCPHKQKHDLIVAKLDMNCF